MKRRQRLAAAMFALATAGSVAPAQAGLLDFLFGGGNARPQYYAPQTPPLRSPEDVARESAARKAADAARRAAAERHNQEQAARNREVIAKLAEISRDHGPRAAFMLDPTLRAGDVVVMPSGLEVFEGKKERTGGNQCRPLRESSLRKRADLALLQQTSGLNEVEKAPPTTGELRPLTIAGPKKKKVVKRKEAPQQAAAPKTADAGFFFTR